MKSSTASRSRTVVLGGLLALLVAAGCREAWPSTAPPVDLARFAAEHEEWRARREARAVTPPGGPVLWIGLWDLPAGATSFGSDPSLPIVLPEDDAPPLAGTLYRSGEHVYLVPSGASGLSLHDGPVLTGRTALNHDRSPDPTRLSLGSLGLRVHSEPGTSRLWLRAWDEDHPLRETFRLPDYYDVDPDWRMPARFDAFAEPRPDAHPDERRAEHDRRRPQDPHGIAPLHPASPDIVPAHRAGAPAEDGARAARGEPFRSPAEGQDAGGAIGRVSFVPIPSVVARACGLMARISEMPTS